MEQQDYYDLEEGTHTQFHGSIHFFNIYKRSLEKISEEPLSQQSSQKQDGFANTSLSLQKKSKSLLMSKDKNQSSEIRVSMEFMVAKHREQDIKENVPQQKTYALSKDFFSEQESNYMSSPDMPTPDFNSILNKNRDVQQEVKRSLQNKIMDYQSLQQQQAQPRKQSPGGKENGHKTPKALNNKFMQILSMSIKKNEKFDSIQEVNQENDSQDPQANPQTTPLLPQPTPTQKARHHKPKAKSQPKNHLDTLGLSKSVFAERIYQKVKRTISQQQTTKSQEKNNARRGGQESKAKGGGQESKRRAAEVEKRERQKRNLLEYIPVENKRVITGKIRNKQSSNRQNMTAKSIYRSELSQETKLKNKANSKDRKVTRPRPADQSPGQPSVRYFSVKNRSCHFPKDSQSALYYSTHVPKKKRPNKDIKSEQQRNRNSTLKKEIKSVLQLIKDLQALYHPH